MTPPGVHINKPAISIIIGLVIVVLGFKYYKGSDDVVSTLNGQDQGVNLPNRDINQGFNKESERLSSNNIENKKMENQAANKGDWKTIDIETVKIPEEIENKAKELKVVEKTYKVMGLDIFTRSVKPTVECKGGVLLLHGQAFTSKNWEEIKTLHYIAAMGYTPIAVDLPNYGQSEKKEVDDRGKFIEELVKVLNFSKPVIISPSMSGTFSLGYLLSDTANANSKVSGFIPVAPVLPSGNKDKIKELKMPAALVYGGNDQTFKKTVEEDLTTMPNSRLFKIEGAGHPAYINKPDVWHKILYVFIRAAYNYN